MARRFRKALIVLSLGLAGLAALIVPPILALETMCRIDGARPEEAAPASIIEPEHRRSEANSYLSYPEWYIVHQYEDFADVLKTGSEPDFRYRDSIAGFWSTLCAVNAITSGSGQSSLEMKTMLYTIGFSFTAEMGIKGLYENTIGRLTEWLRGPEPTEEDLFARNLAEDYATFLHQTPWYEYPFGSQLARFWRETPISGDDPTRKVERRIALSLEYGVKAGYAAVLGYAAGLAPAELRIRSVVEGVSAADLAADERITVVRDLGNGRIVIETPRYRAFTEILRSLVARQARIIEIAGNDDILVTAIASGPETAKPERARTLFALPIQSRPGRYRIGISAKVEDLNELFRMLDQRGAALEHVYDY